MSQKKVVGRNVAIALGIACIALIAGIGGAMAYYTMQMNQKNQEYDSYVAGHTHANSEFNSLNSTYQNYVQTHSHTDSEYSSQYSTLQSQIQTLGNQKTLLQTWLDGNKTLLQATTAKRDQLQTWLNGNITDYETQISSLNTQIGSLNAQVTNLQNQISSLNNQIANLQSQIATLSAAKLIKVNLRADDVRHVYPWDPEDNLHVYGQICNVGTNTAYNCKLHVTAYQNQVVAIDTDIVLGTIGGESWTSIDQSVYYSGGALTSWVTTLQWTT